MKSFEPIDWDKIPDVITKEQFYQICHISKSKARYLLQSGKVPCEYSGKKTRCYRIKKRDVREYMESRNVFPEAYSAPKSWYGSHYATIVPMEMPKNAMLRMHDYYSKLLTRYRDVLTTADISELTGYSKSTINGWCSRNVVRHFSKRNIYYIPKVFLVDFLCSLDFRSITRKTEWHLRTLEELRRILQYEKLKETTDSDCVD